MIKLIIEDNLKAMEKYCEDLVSRLGLSDENVASWYKARHYVLDIMEPLDGNGIGLGSHDHVHVVVDELTPLTLAVIRQICLIAHYPNYNEETGSNKTIFTIFDKYAENAYEQVRQCCYLGNLLNHCRYTINGRLENEENETLPLDIEFEFLANCKMPKSNTPCVFVKSEKVEDAVSGYNKFYMDVTKGMLVNMVYNTGVDIDNLPACDNANIARYSTALNVFCYKLKAAIIRDTWLRDAGYNSDGSYNLTNVKNQLSSVFCGDCFASKLRSILGTKDMSIKEYLLCCFDKVNEKICVPQNIDALVRCEHARWNVEKLIMGFAPLLPEHWYQLESCFGVERKTLIKKWKKDSFNPIHIDLCSYKDLRRINPADMKYDYFLMLAMPQIMLAVEK